MPKDNVRSMPMRPAGIGSRPIAKDYTKDYVVAGGYSAGQQRVLIGTNDDLEIEVDLRTYDKMENDSTITKAKGILVTGTLVDELQLAPGATEDEVGPEEYAVYVEVMELCQRAVDGLDRPYRETLEQLLGNGIKYGHGIAETEWEYRLDGPSTKPEVKTPQADPSRTKSMWARFGMWMGMTSDTQMASPGRPQSILKRPTLNSQKTRLMPRAIKVKPRGAARFVVDDFMNVIGLTPAWRGVRNTLPWDQIVDREKFLVFTMKKQDEDPRGKSAYRSAFNWYNIKTQLPSEILRLVLEEIVPKAVATLSENTQPFEIERDQNGDIVYEDDGTTPKMVTAAESMRFIIENFRSGSGAVVPYGTTLQPFKSGATGTDADLVNKIIKLLDDQMEGAILHQTLAQSEGEHQARSASQQVAEILHNLIFWLRWALCMMTLIDLFEVVVKINLGEWAVRYLPQVGLGDFIRRDWVGELEAYADAYFKGFLDDTQRAEIMANLNLPRPGPSRQELGLDAAAKQDVNGQPSQPNSNRGDKNAGANRNAGNGTEKKNDNKNNASNASAGFGPSYSLGHNKRRLGFFSRHLPTGRK